MLAGQIPSARHVRGRWLSGEKQLIKRSTCVRSPSRDHSRFWVPAGCSLGPMSWLPEDFVHPVHVRCRRRASPAADQGGGRRDRLSGRDGLARAAMGDLRPGLGLARGDDDLRGGPSDLLRHEEEIAATSPSTTRCSMRRRPFSSAASTSTRRSEPARTARSPGGWWTNCWRRGGARAGRAGAAVDRRRLAVRRPRYLGRDITWPDWLALPPAS